MDLLLDAVCVVDTRGCFAFISAAGERIFGYTPEEMVGRPMIDFVFHEDRAKTLQAVDGILDGHLQPHFENRYVRKDGQVVHIMWSARWSEADQVRVAVARDITERMHADTLQAALYAISDAAHAAEDLVALFQQIHHILVELLPAANFFVALYDKNKDELTFPYAVDEYGEAPGPQKLDSTALSAEVVRTGQALLVPPNSGEGLPGRPPSDVGRDSSNWLGVPLCAKNGVIGALVVQSDCAEARYTNKDIELLQFVADQITPVIERKQMEVWLQHIAQHDPLTDLPNRELFHDRLQTALRWAERNQTPPQLALLYLDLDKFKQVNDTLGHPVGDLLLQEAARRLSQCVRNSDTVGRVGGDEFLVLLNGITLPEQALSIAEKIRVALGHPFELAGHKVHISPSIGVALYPEHGDDYKQLIRYADEAMYAAKKSGGNRVQVTSSPSMLNTPKS
ncbi:diguanylate cyclase domain-containing protein [Thiobacillus denitrificans]|nr:diguanylate cyclase [Thiobacillus denitrificans]